jgi:hypothetical protein
MTTLDAINKWEAAWEAYVDAIAAYDESLPRRFDRGWRRLHTGNSCRRRDAITRLRNLDADFCDRVGIK